MTLEVLFATTNPGKVREAQAIVERSGLVLQVVPMWLGEEETGTGYAENARLKAAAALRFTGRPVLAEDAGLEVYALGGLPGPRSARFAGPAATDEDNNAKLLRLMDDVPDGKRGAYYQAVAVLLMPSGVAVSGEGRWDGCILRAGRGTGGFGYDPLFVPQGEERTAAELTAEEKNASSHRTKALRMLLERAGDAGLL